MKFLDHKIEIINPLTYSNWDEMILDTNEYSLFHTSAWAQILHETYNYTPRYFCSIENNHLKTLLPFMEIDSWLTGSRAVSLPFTDYCPIILDSEMKYEDLIKKIIHFGKSEGWRSIEFRHNRDRESEDISSDSFFEHSLDLKSGEKNLYEKLRSSTRRNIKKAQKSGVKTKISTSLASLKEYYHLHCLTRKRQGIPPQPFAFFKNIFHFILNERKGFVILAMYENVVISGMIFLFFGKKAIYKFGASSLKYQELRSNNLLMWEGIKNCIKLGCEQLSLGRTERNNSGLRQFKNGWAAKESIIKYYRYSLKNDRYISESSGIFRYAIKTIKILPINLLKLSGKIAYKHFG
jgi:hypothetical protein